MKWFRENRFLGRFLVVFGVVSIAATWFLFTSKSEWNAALLRFNRTAAELNRLERLAPYPSEENLGKMKADAEEYGNALARLRDELKLRVASLTPMKPNEFQSRLRVATAAIVQKARSNQVKLPDKFYLGFDEFAAALPSEVAAPVLGQELGQIEWFLNCLIESRIEALTAFHRAPLPEENAAPAVILSPTPGAAAKPLLARNVVEATFVSTPAAARRVLNQIAGANEQFCLVRLLHVRNEKQKGPPHEPAAETPGLVATKKSPAPALNFIVGNERIETRAKIEIVRFVF